MKRILIVSLLTLLASLYYFQITLTFFPFANTKKTMAALSVLLLLIQAAYGRSARLNKDLFVLSVWALMVSFASYVSMTINDSPDSAYLGYVMSMWVWLGGAYFVGQVIKRFEGRVTVDIVCKYFIAACLFQVISAMLMDQIYEVKTFVAKLYYGMWGLDKFCDGRLYGIGADFDVGGARLATGLVMIGVMFYKEVCKEKLSWGWILYYMISFALILVIGNMISRTTTIGAAIALVYWGYEAVFGKKGDAKVLKRLGLILLVTISVTVPIVTYYYNNDAAMREQIEYAFEGFFSLAEKGEWDVSSNNSLWGMYGIWPETLHTWIIGDGYMGPTADDPYYVGEYNTGFYKGVDAGYLRFLFYFGIIGLGSFIIFMIIACHICGKKNPAYKKLFFLLLLANMVVWVKVSTDLFCALAIFLFIDEEEPGEDEALPVEQPQENNNEIITV